GAVKCIHASLGLRRRARFGFLTLIYGPTVKKSRSRLASLRLLSLSNPRQRLEGKHFGRSPTKRLPLQKILVGARSSKFERSDKKIYLKLSVDCSRCRWCSRIFDFDPGFSRRT